MNRRSKGFTLIELLIVVAIIGILAAIAIPNFLEAQVRAKVARVKSDLRSIGVAEEAYYVDNDCYSLDRDIQIDPGDPLSWSEIGGYWTLTTPIAYITTVPTDPFNKRFSKPDNAFYEYMNEDTMDALWHQDGSLVVDSLGNAIGYKQFGIGWFAYSYGPALEDFGLGWMPPEDWPYRSYDPTNGTMSLGNVGRCNRGVVPLE